MQKRKVTCYFVVQLADGSILPPEKRVLTVEGNCVTTSFNGLLCKFFVPDTGSEFLYEVSSPQPLATTSSILTARQIHILLDSSYMSQFLQSTEESLLFLRIFGRKAVPMPLSLLAVLEEVEKSGVVEGDFIIFSRKVWEELKTK